MMGMMRDVHYGVLTEAQRKHYEKLLYERILPEYDFYPLPPPLSRWARICVKVKHFPPLKFARHIIAYWDKEVK